MWEGMSITYQFWISLQRAIPLLPWALIVHTTAAQHPSRTLLEHSGCTSPGTISVYTEPRSVVPVAQGSRQRVAVMRSFILPALPHQSSSLGMVIVDYSILPPRSKLPDLTESMRFCNRTWALRPCWGPTAERNNFSVLAVARDWGSTPQSQSASCTPIFKVSRFLL
jgi:hypothetical protein